jgi:hypothetical protein
MVPSSGQQRPFNWPDCPINTGFVVSFLSTPVLTLLWIFYHHRYKKPSGIIINEDYYSPRSGTTPNFNTAPL